MMKSLKNSSIEFAAIKAVYAIILSWLMLLAAILSPVYARAEGVSGVQISGKTKEAHKFIPGEDAGLDSEELFAGYLDQEIYSAAGIEEEKEVQVPSDESGSRIEAKKNTGIRLTGNDQKIYQVLMKEIAETAAGKRESTWFEVGVEEFGLKNKYFTARDLGVTRLTYYDNGSLTVAPEAANALYNKLDHNLSKIITALLVDCPYELYWYDKTAVTNSYYPDIYLGNKEGDPALRFDASMTFSFPVEKDYAMAGETYKVDSQTGQKVQTSAANAAKIVADYQTLSDFDKMDSYRKEICSLVSYHEEAMRDDWDYGNPWQLIWVFDGDPSTNVVCEGYAKAFQYLCDLSTFNRDIQCITVNGVFYVGEDSENHMWNVVDMDDETNDEARYLVDLTNCDEGTIGADQWLFLAAAETGSVENGFYFDCDGRGITYCYDQKKIMTYYSRSELLIHVGEAYNPQIAIQRRKSVGKAQVSGLGSFTRTGKAICPRVKVSMDGKTLDASHDYDITYRNNTNVGTAAVLITGKGRYKGSLTKSFRIIPRNVKKIKLKRMKKAFKAKWTRQLDQVTGYQIQYSLKSSFKDAKTKTIKKNKTNYVTIRNLKRKKKYYVRIRTYKKIGTARYYSSWSKKLSIKTR